MGIIDKSKKNIKLFIHSSYFDDFFWVFVVIFVALASFALGMRHEREVFLQNHPIQLKEDSVVVSAWKEYVRTRSEDAQFFASKNGSVYYPLACPSGARIKKENRIYFSNTREAEEAGYQKSSRCF